MHGLVLTPMYPSTPSGKGWLYIPDDWNPDAFQNEINGIDILTSFAPVRYALFCEMLPDRDGERKIVMGHVTYDTLEQAEEAIRKVRLQNLPFRAWAVPVIDPRL